MRFTKKILLLLVLMVAGSFGAAAQESTIRFKLAQETRIASVVLPAGAYRMVLYNEGHPYALLIAEDGQRSSVMALPLSTESKYCASSSLTLTPAGDSMSIASVCFAEADTALSFPVMAARKEFATQTTATTALAGAR